MEYLTNISKIFSYGDGFNNLRKVTLSNSYMSVELLNLGATIYAINVPGNDCPSENVVLNYENIQDYDTDNYYLGCSVGRVAGRISQGIMPIGDEKAILTKNEMGIHHLHGGNNGLNKKCFEISSLTSNESSCTVRFFTISQNMEEGYPGNLKIWITYKLNRDNSLEITYQAVSDKLTHVNLTNHSYFNLTGKKQPVLKQQLHINSEHILATDLEYIPTGTIINIKKQPRMIFCALRQIEVQKEKNNGRMFNECFILKKNRQPDAIFMTRKQTGHWRSGPVIPD